MAPRKPYDPKIPDNTWGPAAVAHDDLTQWLIDNPDFDDRPATMLEFLGPGYLDIDYDQNPALGNSGVIRPGVKAALIDIFGEKVDPESISEKREALFTGGIGIGKGQRADDLVCTPKGWREIGSLTVGDEVTGSNGKATTVTGVYPRGILPMFRVRFSDDTYLDVDGDHLWNVQSPKQKMRGSGWRTLSTRELLNGGVVNGRGQKKWHIPLVAPVEYDGLDNFSIEPYTLGALIGDGGLTQKSVNFTTVDQELLDEVTAEVLDHFPALHVRQKDAQTYTFTHGRRGVPNPLADELERLGVMGKHSWNKRVPEQYLRASAGARRRLLRGLMDTDGWHNPKIGYSEFCTVSEGLAADVAELVRSLGGVAKVKTRDDTGGRRAYLVAVRTTFNPFHLSRKRQSWQPNAKYKPTKMITSIEPVEAGEVVCIQVAAEDQLYVAKDHIVTHNTTMASVALAYMVHWVLCLHDPQKYFGLMPGSRIAFMLMSTKDSQAKEVLFGDIKARIDNAEWFKQVPTDWKKRSVKAYDPDFKNQLRFPKDIWVLPGNSAETTFEGYNILGGILDEGDSHKTTENKDYAEVGWRTIKARVTSRFTNPETGEHRGLLIAIGQMKIAQGFMARTKTKMEKANEKNRREGKPELAKVVHMAIWESFGWEKYRNKKTGKIEVFWYDIDRKIIVPPAAASAVQSDRIIKIPISYQDDFEMDPVQALKDHAGIPPHVDDPFIGVPDRVREAQEAWSKRFPDFLPVVGRPDRPQFHESFGYPENPPSAVKRVLHTDIAYAAHGDALGMAMAHIPELVEINGEIKPVIVFDFLLRIKPSGGQKLMLSDFRKLIFEVRDERKFKIAVTSFDGFQSQDSIQILREKRFNTAELSVDRTKGPYEELREAIYERRIEFPPMHVYLKKGDVEKVNIVEKELLELTDTGRKIDHPPKGSKDVADAMAGCVWALMSNDTFRRGARRVSPVDTGDDLGIDVFGERSTIDPAALGQEFDPEEFRKLLGDMLPPMQKDPFSALRRGM